MRRFLNLACACMLLSASAGAWPDAPGGAPNTATTKTPAGPGSAIMAGGLSISPDDLIMTAKADKLYVLWDAFPYRGALAALRPAVGMDSLAFGLVQAYALKRHPKARTVTVSIVEYPSRDSYGAPRYDLAKTIGRYRFSVDVKNGQPHAEPNPTPAP